MKRVLFIANIGAKKNSIPNGVNIKNRHILRFLKENKGFEVKLIDTDKWKKRFLYLFFEIMIQSFKSERIILSINTKSAYQIIKFLNILNLDRKLIYIVVGGSLPEEIKKGNLKSKYYNNISRIFVETKKMLNDLKSIGLNNVERLVNSKYFTDITVDYERPINIPIKAYYLGRIHPDKGINLLLKALDKVNSNTTQITIDFFGPVEANFENDFNDFIKEKKYAEFKGTIDLINNSNAYLMLSNYDLFIFPTFWAGEGFPGVVLDSFISGVPVLASDWNHNKEVIIDGVNGMIFKDRNMNDFVLKLQTLIDNPEELIKMRRNAHQESIKYKSENVLIKIMESI